MLIPPNCTDQLQPIDLSVIGLQRSSYRLNFKSGMPNNCVLNKQAVDLHLSIVKLLGAKWMIKFYNYKTHIVKEAD